MHNKPNNKPSILIIYTGGTIGMIENPATGALEPLDFDYLKINVPELQHIGCDISTEQFVPPIDSSAINPNHWSKMAHVIRDRYDEFDGFVILHGTDTMAYTASALSFMLKHLTKPVILTGSQLPIGKLRTDGKENLITAIEIAAATLNGHPRVPEVCIFFQNRLMRGNRTSKVSADQFNAFESYNHVPLAYAGIDIKYNDSVIRYPDSWDMPLEVKDNMETGVAILKIFPGITPDLLQAVLNIPTLRGLVLETFGSGNAPLEDWFCGALTEAVKRGLVIMNVTQCVSGYVDMTRYETGHQLMSSGILSGYDATTECTIVKLMYLLGQGYSIEKVKRLMDTSLRGEIDR